MSVYIPVELRRQIRATFHNRCAYCQTAESLTAMTFEIEHIQPVSAGGETVFENLCFACPFCNRQKGDCQTAVDPVQGESVSIFHPHQQSWLEHFAWIQQGRYLRGLTPTGRATIEALQMNRSALVRVRAMWVKLDEHPPEVYA